MLLVDFVVKPVILDDYEATESTFIILAPIVGRSKGIAKCPDIQCIPETCYEPSMGHRVLLHILKVAFVGHVQQSARSAGRLSILILIIIRHEAS